MTKKELEDSVITLVAMARRTTTNWHEQFSAEQVEQLRNLWNKGLAEWSQDYWHKGDN